LARTVQAKTRPAAVEAMTAEMMAKEETTAGRSNWRANRHRQFGRPLYPELPRRPGCENSNRGIQPGNAATCVARSGQLARLPAIVDRKQKTP